MCKMSFKINSISKIIVHTGRINLWTARISTQILVTNVKAVTDEIYLYFFIFHKKYCFYHG